MGDCNGVANPWFCNWTWYNAQNRLLISAICLRSRKTVLVILGFLCSAHLLAAQLVYLFNPDEFNLIWWWGGESGGNIYWHLFWTLLEHELTQGFLAALLVSYILYRFFRHPFRNRLTIVFRYVVAIGLIILLLGYASNFISHGKAERKIAQWILIDIIQGPTLYGDCLQAGWDDWLTESATRFLSVGATVLKMDCGDIGSKVSWGEVGPSSFTGPFIISVRYMAVASDGVKAKSGDCLMLNFYGYTKILKEDSSLFRRMIPYLWPY
jgi:hypothetical protein